MKRIGIVELFVHIDEGLKDQTARDLLSRKRFRTDAQMSISELATLLVCFHDSGARHMKAFYLQVKRWMGDLFPKLVCYSRFMKWMRDCRKALELLLEENLSPWAGFGMIDSSKIPVAHNDRKRPKVFRKTATYGHTAFGRFYGFKLHLLCGKKGEIVRWKITTGSCHDLTPVKEVFLEGITGKVLADSGYVSRDQRFKLMDKNMELIAKQKARQDELDRWDWNKANGRLYKLRQRIEGVFNNLKNDRMMVSVRDHHPVMLEIYVLSAMLAYQLDLAA